MDLEERNRLVIDHLGLVWKIARDMRRTLPPQVDVEDLVSVGVIGLIQAVDRYDPTRPVRLAGFARSRIKGAILDYLRSRDNAKRTTRGHIKEIQRTWTELSKSLDRGPTEAEMIARLQMSIEKYRELCGLVENLKPALESVVISRRAPGARGMREETNGEKREFHVEMSPDPNPSPLDRAMEAQLRDRIDAAIGRLRPRHQQAIRLYFWGDFTLRETGSALGINESRVSQMVSASLKQLRARLAQAA